MRHGISDSGIVELCTSFASTCSRVAADLPSQNVHIGWDKAIRVLDRPERAGIDTATLKLIVAILTNAPEDSPGHPVNGFWEVWSNTIYQLRLIDKLLALPSDTFSFIHLPGKRVVTVDDVASASATIKALAANVQNSTWNSLDLFTLLVRLGDHDSAEVKLFVRDLMDRAVRVSAEIVHMGLLQVPVSPAVGTMSWPQC